MKDGQHLLEGKHSVVDRWLTYQQAGELLGLSVEAVRQRARRRRWRTQPGNDGRTLVLVPEQSAVHPHVQPTGRPNGHPYAQLPPHLGEVEALRELVSALQAQIARLEAQGERERADYLAQLNKAEAATERERQERQADLGRHAEEIRAERERLEQARAALAAAQEVWEARLDGLVADLTEERKGRTAEADARARAEREAEEVRAELERLRTRPWWWWLFGSR